MADNARANDVLFGRGGATNNHSGNKKFRTVVAEHQPEYLGARKRDKAAIARRIVRIVRSRGGRFLRRDEGTGTWTEVGDKKATEKTSQALREGLDVRHNVGKSSRRNSESSVSTGDARSKKRRKMDHAATPSSSDTQSPALVSVAGEVSLVPEFALEEDMPSMLNSFVFQLPPVTTADCDQVVEV